MILIQQLKLRIPHSPEAVRSRAAKALMIPEREILSMEILRRSIDARKKPELFAIYSLEIQVKDEEKVLSKARQNPRAKEQFSLSTRQRYCFPDIPGKGSENMSRQIPGEDRPVIAGAGPAGLFCAYYLALAGQNPLLLERGRCVEERRRDVETFWRTGKLDPLSNVQFGEGGAGTFSDGKLNTLVRDNDGRGRAVLETLVKFGAKESILYDAKPHIGTDVLSEVVKNLREEIRRLGGEVRFESQVSDLEIENGRLTGIVINEKERLACKRLVLAIGHSARDTFFMLHERNIPMEEKAFAVGFRVEHPQEMINLSQYGCARTDETGAAPYKVTARASNGRGVYSFCMCPGGYVVNASSEEGYLAVNGMSYSKRDGGNANSAIIVAVTPDDYPGDGPLAGIAFQRELERRAHRLGGGKVPVQRYGDYRRAVCGDAEGQTRESFQGDAERRMETKPEKGIDGAFQPCCKGETVWADLSGLLPRECSAAFVEGMEQFARQIRGFNRPDAVLSGVESRTSSPVRIIRDGTLQTCVRGIYPCGEGAGYAGGIMSAAMDGLRVAEEIVKRQGSHTKAKGEE